MKKSLRFKILILGLLLLTLAMNRVNAQEILIKPLEDVTVFEQYPDSVKKSGNLHVYRNPERLGGKQAIALLKFDIRKFAFYKATDVRFTYRGKHPNTGVLDYNLALFKAGNWKQDTMSWSKKPSITTNDTLAFSPLNNNSTSARKEFVKKQSKLLDFINARLAAGDSVLTLAIYSYGKQDTITNMWIGGKEDGSYGPELSLVLTEKVLTPLEDVTVFEEYADSCKRKGNLHAFHTPERLGGKQAIAFVKFDISAFAGYKASDIKLSYRGKHPNTGVLDYNLALFKAGNWGSDTMQWAKKPNISTTDTFAISPLNNNSTSARKDFVKKTTKFLDYVNAQLAAGATYISLAVKSYGTQDTITNMWIGGKEDGSYGPQLTIVIAEQLVSASMDVTVFEEFPDSCKRSGNLHAFKTPERLGGKQAIALLKFDVTNMAGYKATDVRISYRGKHPNTGVLDYKIALFKTANWNQDTMKWASQPSITTKDTLATSPLNNNSTSARKDFTKNASKLLDYVNAQLAAGATTLNFALKSYGTQDTITNMWIGGKEDGAYGPQITFVFAQKPTLPTLDPPSGTYIKSVVIKSINQPTQDTVFYRTGGGKLNRTAPIFPTSGITFEPTTKIDTLVVRAIAYRGTATDSVIATYIVKPVDDVLFDPTPTVQYTSENLPLVVKLSTKPGDALILYSLGSESTPSTFYSDATGIPIDGSTVIRARAMSADGQYTTPIFEGTYNITNKLPGFGYGPGGVGFKNNTIGGQPELSMWLKADSITGVADGSELKLWKDISGNNNNATNTFVQGGNNSIPNYHNPKLPAPIFEEKGLNGKPTVNFGITTASSMVVNDADNLDGSLGISAIVVVQRNNATFPGKGFEAILEKRDFSGDAATNWLKNAYILEFNGGADMDKPMLTVNKESYFFGGTDASRIRNNNAHIIIGDHDGKLSTLWIDGKNDGFKAYNKAVNATAAPLILNGNGGTFMSIAEAIVYRQSLNAAQRVIVNNYLAAKYSLPLTSSSIFTNYEYGNDLIGIGKAKSFDGTKYEEHNNSVGGAMVLKATTAFADDSVFVMAGHNGVKITESNNKTWSRVWYVQTKGSILPPVSLSFDYKVAGLPTPATATDLKLWTKATPTADWTDVGITPVLANNQLTFTVPALTTGYFCMGKTPTFVTGLEPSGIEANTNDLLVYPNPTNSHLNLQIINEISGTVQVRILDNLGRVCIMNTFNKPTSPFEERMDVSKLLEGVYFIEVMQNGERKTKFFVKQ